MDHLRADFINRAEQSEIFGNALLSLIQFTGSENEFIGRILNNDEGEPFLKTYSLNDISRDDETRDFHKENAIEGIGIRNIETLFDAVTASGEAIISNSATADSRDGGTPDDQPVLDAFIGLPIKSGSDLLGMVGLAKKPVITGKTLIEELKPALDTCANLIQAAENEAKRQVLSNQFQTVMDNASNAIGLKDSPGNYVLVNHAFARRFNLDPDDFVNDPQPIFFPSPKVQKWKRLIKRYSGPGK